MKKYENEYIESLGIENGKLEDVIYENCIFKDFKIKDSTLKNVQFNYCNLPDILWENVTVTDSTIDFCFMQNSKILNSSFKGCESVATDYSASEFKDTDFRDTDFDGSEFHMVKVINSDLSQCTLSNVRMGMIEGLEAYTITNIFNGYGQLEGDILYIPKYNKIYSQLFEGTLEEYESEFFYTKMSELNENGKLTQQDKDKLEKLFIISVQFFKEC